MDNQFDDAMTVAEYEAILCDFCKNYPLSYQCPACQKQACLYCLDRKFKKQKAGGVKCAHCEHVDARWVGRVDPDLERSR